MTCWISSETFRSYERILMPQADSHDEMTPQSGRNTSMRNKSMKNLSFTALVIRHELADV